ncbi:Endopeptidase La [Methylacidimicrobium sp. AP8]|uniref:Lon protease family protein n=1 Tax=Methylacidimicrobium sp. AP8 TaxID=2730359 RepID=UPI0018C02123|nr:ATP-binding protein [Methylacidimicrobium sp. AP8]CAB4242614.1 Endopeptidase La [Methylacidimicrobium sp. AP8]
MRSDFRLDAKTLDRRIDPARLPFETTAELTRIPGVLGQTRATEAMRFGIGMEQPGYNLFVMGPSGVGKRTVVLRLLRERAAGRSVPQDWAYVFAFDNERRPRALGFPPGKAREFAEDMDRFVEDLRAGIPAVFDSDEYRARAQDIEQRFHDRRDRAFSELRDRAQKDGIALLQTPAGFAFAPLKDGEVLDPESFAKLPEEEKQKIQNRISAWQEELTRVIREIPKWRREAQAELRELNRSVVHSTVSNLLEELKTKYSDMPAVHAHLESVERDALKNAESFRPPKEGDALPPGMNPPGIGPDPVEAFLRRYRVNVVVDQRGAKGCPVVLEENPTFSNLFGTVEHVAQMGALVTDFSLIRPGSLHKANGGYLAIDALRLLSHPFSWEGLKRALRSRQIRIEPLGEALGILSTVSLEPEPIPLEVKVVLLGERWLYYLLHELDPEFSELFKVVADFEEDIDRSEAILMPYAEFLADEARKANLLPMDRGAVARLLEEGSRIAADGKKLTLRRRAVTDLLQEADFWARDAAARIITEAHVEKAIAAAEARSGRIRERLREEVLRGTLLVDCDGESVGQVNGLAVFAAGGVLVGHPTRITARARFGSGKVVDIEREAKLGGPIHSKGVLILSGFLAGRYVPEEPLSLTATLVFEQSYGIVDGDSASCAELCALLSTLADLPIRQSLAITGSINQKGRVQAIGGVNEKVEAFFDICRARSLTGRQGVIIPAANVDHLVLRREVLEKVEQGLFHLYAVETVDQAMELLTGLPAGERGPDGRYPEESVNGRVERKLSEFARRARSLSSGGAQA